jgi:hypothetical protein
MNTLLSPIVTPAQRKAAQLKQFPAAQFNQLLTAWKQQVSLLWDDQDPQAILDVIGTDGAELFTLSASLAAFLESQKEDCTAATLAKVKPFTVEQDGSVTITPES